MTFRDLLKKKDKHAEAELEPAAALQPEFKIYRTDTVGTELIASSNPAGNPTTSADGAAESKHRGLFSRDRSASNASGRSVSSKTDERPKRLSQRFNLRRDDQTSNSVPADLPEIATENVLGEGEQESQWEKRATMLARKNEESRSRPATPVHGSAADLNDFASMRLGDHGNQDRTVVSKKADDNVQEAIRLHESGDLVTATKMFGRLADPDGENNALSQVLYGLALRYVLRETFWSLFGSF